MPSKARGASRSLLVVDVESRSGARRVLEWRARRMTARLGARGHDADRLPQVLLHLPDGVGPSPGWPRGADVVRTVDRISTSRLKGIHERVFARSFEILRGAAGTLFPEVCGVGLGQLNLGMMQEYLTSFSLVSSALGDVLDAGEVGACHIVSADVGFSRALARQVSGRAETTSTWPPWWLLEAARLGKSDLSRLRPADPERAEDAARDAMARVLREHGLEGARPRVLIVSESAPMAQMFSVIEDALSRAGVGPIVRLDSSGAAPRSGSAGITVCRCPAPGALGLRTGLFRAQWRDAQRKLRNHPALAALGAEDSVLLEGLLGYLYVSKFDTQARHLWASDAALELLQPEVVIVGNDRAWAGQGFVHLARRHGIPSVCVQDGVAGDVPFWWWLTADCLAATSAQLVQMLVRHGVGPERCRVTGQPRYDLLSQSGPQDQLAARATLGLDPATFSVLFAVQAMHGPDYVRSVVSALCAVPGIHVMLRPHPGDRSCCGRTRVIGAICTSGSCESTGRSA